MEIGKLPNDLLQKIVFSNIKNKRKEVLVRAAVGEDNAIVDFGDEVCVMSTDPITGTTKDIGRLAVYISCNDVASSGAEPIGILLTVLLPPATTEEEIEAIMKEAGEASKELNVEIIGGHTEITDAVNRVIISSTVIGKQKKESLLDSRRVKAGDRILMTKYAAIEGTSIIARELKEYLKGRMDEKKLNEALNMGNMISVIKEGIIAGEIGVSYMHDITEGGVLGAVWEASVATGKGVKVYEDRIPMKEATREIAKILNINPYRLISSGSMLIIADSKKAELLKERLNKENIPVTEIGEIIEDGILLQRGEMVEEILPPGSDELYKALLR
ncbi:MAG TPA: AIR synthase [Tissierellia bacterium]|nr:AIR synthase [Tissierellia bacterium]